MQSQRTLRFPQLSCLLALYAEAHLTYSQDQLGYNAEYPCLMELNLAGQQRGYLVAMSQPIGTTLGDSLSKSKLPDLPPARPSLQCVHPILQDSASTVTPRTTRTF